MTIANDTTKIQTDCNGSETNYVYNFKIFADADLRVIVTNTTTEVETLLTLNSHYTVNGAGDAGGGSIDLTAAGLAIAASGTYITLKRDMAYIQEYDPENGDVFDADTVEDTFDKLVMMIQQLKEELSRAVLLPETSKATPYTYSDDDGYTLEITSGGGFSGVEAKTIVSGVITLTGVNKFRRVAVDTEAAAASDNLDTISGGNVGDLLIVQAANDARTVVCKNGTSLKLQYDFSLNDSKDKLILICTAAGVWHELARANNG